MCLTSLTLCENNCCFAFYAVFGIFINVLMDVFLAETLPGPEVIKGCFSCSTHKSMKFVPVHVINFKMSTVVGI